MIIYCYLLLDNSEFPWNAVYVMRLTIELNDVSDYIVKMG